MKLETKHDFGDVVYLIIDADQKERMIVGIRIEPPNNVLYSLSDGYALSEHYEFEINSAKDMIKAMSN